MTCNKLYSECDEPYEHAFGEGYELGRNTIQSLVKEIKKKEKKRMKEGRRLSHVELIEMLDEILEFL